MPPPVMIDSAEGRKLATHMLCCSWAIYFSAAASSKNDQGLEHGALSGGLVGPCECAGGPDEAGEGELEHSTKLFLR
jgi:hypothetical protein